MNNTTNSILAKGNLANLTLDQLQAGFRIARDRWLAARDGSLADTRAINLRNAVQAEIERRGRVLRWSEWHNDWFVGTPQDFEPIVGAA